MRWIIGAVALLLAGPASAETLLRLTQTAAVRVAPDELQAAMRAEAQAPGAAAAQAAVNAAMEKAVAEMHATGGIQGGTGGYVVFQVAQPNPHWQAGESLTFTGGDGAAVLALVGRLQAQGLAVQSLGWQVRAATAQAAHAQAEAKALAALRVRAEAVAKVLGLRFDSFREIRLDGARPAPPGPRLLMGAAAMAAPVAEATDQEVSASVEADAVLK